MGSGAFPHLTGILCQGYVPHVMQPVLDFPMPPRVPQQRPWIHFTTQAGDPIAHFAGSLGRGGLSWSTCAARYPAHLPYFRPLQIVVERVGGLQLPDFPTVAVPVLGLGLPAMVFPTGLRKGQGDVSV